MPECQKLKMAGYTSMAKCKALTGSMLKGLTITYRLWFDSMALKVPRSAGALQIRLLLLIVLL